METDFVLESLDALVRESLSLEDVPHATPAQAKKATAVNKDLLTTIKQERNRIELELARQVFKIQKAGVIRSLITKNHDYLVALLDSLYYQSTSDNEMAPKYDAIFDILFEQIGILLEFFDRFFPSYISQEKKVPIKYLVDIKTDLSEKLASIRSAFTARIGDDALTSLVLDEVDHFISDDRNEDSVTFGAVKYFRELVDEMETLSEPEKKYCVFSALNEFLIRSDFNSRRYVNHFTAREEKQLESLGENGDKMSYLLKRRKEFSEMHVRTDHRLDGRFPGVKESILNWYNNEIDFIEVKNTTYIWGDGRMSDEEIRNLSKAEKLKVMLDLSGDQIGIAVRAAFERKFILGKSLAHVFDTVIPLFSTKWKDELSPASTRTSSYNAERRDKDVLVNMFKQMIEQVESY